MGKSTHRINARRFVVVGLTPCIDACNACAVYLDYQCFAREGSAVSSPGGLLSAIAV